MLIEVRLGGDDAEDDLRSFCAWLRDEPDIRRHASVTLETGAPVPGGLGAPLEVIQLVIDSSFQLASLALAYAAWRATRRNPGDISVRRDGDSIALPSPAAADPGTGPAAPGPGAGSGGTGPADGSGESPRHPAAGE
ncbi:hypothetical protein [Streptomyces sp. CAU 1734]|uniref:effector-associated constant component EACC1 n=1 Tax=Streptomyces sp. CAU 1734 TaxID=3140360 RepID=UPI00326156F6